jgi:hypothetical protein
MGLNHLPNEEPMLGDLPTIVEATLEVRVALLDQRRTDLARRQWREVELLKFVDLVSRAIATPTTSFTRSVVGKLITHSLLRRSISKLWFASQM